MSTLKTHNLQSPDAGSVNIAMTPNAGMIVAGLSTYSNQLDVGSNIKLGNAGVITATRIVSTIGTFGGDAAISGSLQIADTIQHEGDVNTKIRFPAVDTFSVETAGSEKLRITSTGYVGISSNTPTAPLEIHTNASNAWNFRINTSVSDGAGFYQRANGDFELVLRDASNNNNHIAGTSGGLQFVTTSTEKVRIASDGDVGIGTISPVERLHVHKASATGPFMYITNTSTGVSASDGIQIGYDGTNTAVLKNNEPTDLVFYAGSQNFRITSSGHVLPATNNTQDLGSTAKGWRNVYMNDLNLSNMNGDTNDVDGTQGSWTIQEGKDDLYIINRLNGKKFKIKMEEIS